jgi:hypothetical protein
MADMSPARKRLAIAFIAIGIALIVGRTLASAGDAEAVAPVERVGGMEAAGAVHEPPPRAARVDAVAPSLHLDRLSGRAAATASNASSSTPLFTAQSWQPAPVPAPPPVPVEPEAPPFPYTYMGGLSDERGRTAFFNRGDRVLAVRAGETIDGAYRVDHLDETLMTLNYVALNKTVQVALGAGR